MVAEAILLRIGAEAVVGPTVSAVLSKVATKQKQRRRCSSLYTMLLNSPAVLKDEVARMGVEEGCWTESFVNTLRKANRIVHIEEDSIAKEVTKVVESPDTITDLITGDVDDTITDTVKAFNKQLLDLTLNE